MQVTVERPKWLSRCRVALELTSTIALIIAAAVLTWVGIRTLRSPATQGAPQAPPIQGPLPTRPLSLAAAWKKGQPGAGAAVVVYSDFQCPVCATFAREVLPEIYRDYIDTGKALVAFRHFPIERIHPFAFSAAEASECAGNQGAFWPMHDLLFDQSDPLTRDGLISRAQRLNLNQRLFEACVAGEAVARVRRDVTDARALDIRGAPTIFVGEVRPDGDVNVTMRFNGLVRARRLAQTLDEVLNAGAKGR